MIGIFIEIGGERVAVSQKELIMLHDELSEYFSLKEEPATEEELTAPDYDQDSVVYDSEDI